MRLGRRAPHRIVDLFRTGDRSVYAIPEWAGFGNQLFFLLWGATQRWQGRDLRLIRSARSEPWLERFPLMRDELTVARDEVRFYDQRARGTWSEMPGRFTTEQRNMFVERYLIPSGLFVAAPDDRVVVNVRRGDYYSDPAVRGRFSFDQIAYLQVVRDCMLERPDTMGKVVVVSDDVGWCRERLSFLGDGATALEFQHGPGPLDDLATVGSTRRLVITNSTFSIWGAYISNYLHENNHAEVYAPAFGTRPHLGEPWDSVDRRWSIVWEIPGGWDS